jgi:hypothetical protein
MMGRLNHLKGFYSILSKVEPNMAARKRLSMLWTYGLALDSLPSTCAKP